MRKEKRQKKEKQKQIKRIVLLKRNFPSFDSDYGNGNNSITDGRAFGGCVGGSIGRSVGWTVMLIMNVMEFSMMRIHEISCETISNPFDKYGQHYVGGGASM